MAAIELDVDAATVESAVTVYSAVVPLSKPVVATALLPKDVKKINDRG